MFPLVQEGALTIALSICETSNNPETAVEVVHPSFLAVSW